MSHGEKEKSFSERTILFALNLLCRKRAIGTGQSRFEKGTRPFRYKFYAELFICSKCRIFVWCFTYIIYREESRYGQKADFGPAKPKGRSQTWPVEAFCPYLLSSKEDT